MSLGQDLIALLDKGRKEKESIDCDYIVNDGKVAVKASVTGYGSFGYEIDKIEVELLKLNATDRLQGLEKQKKRIEDKNNFKYLLCNFIGELDARKNIAKLKSSPTEVKDQRVNFYQIMLYNGNKLTFERISALTNGEYGENRIPIYLPEKHTKQLINDLTSIVRGY